MSKKTRKKVVKKEKKTDLKAAIKSIDNARIAHKEKQEEAKKLKKKDLQEPEEAKAQKKYKK